MPEIASPNANPLYELDLQHLVNATLLVANNLAPRKDSQWFSPLFRGIDERQRLLSRAFEVFDAWPEEFNRFLDGLCASGGEADAPGGVSQRFASIYPILFFRAPFTPPAYDFMRKAFETYLTTRWDGSLIHSRHKTISQEACRRRKYVAKIDVAKALQIGTNVVDDLLERGYLRGVTRERRKRNVSLIERSSMEELIESRRNVLTAKQAAMSLKLSIKPFLDLVTHGFFTAVDNPFRRGQLGFKKDAVEDLLAKIENRISDAPMGSDVRLVEFHEAVNTLGAIGFTVSGVVREVLEGRIRPFGDGSGTGLSRFRFDKKELSRYVRDDIARKRGDLFFLGDAAKSLGMHGDGVMALVELNILPAGARLSDNSRSPVVFNEKAVDEFKRTYVSGAEVAKRYRSSPWCLRRLLANRGVEVAFGRRNFRRLGDHYRRSDLESLDIGEMFAARAAGRARRKRKSRLLNSEKAAGLLGVPEESLRRLVRIGDINARLPKGRTLGKGVHLRFCRFDLARYKQRTNAKYLVSAREAARLLGEDLSWFYKKWVRTGRLPKVEFEDKLGKHFFQRRDVEALADLKKSTVTGSEAAEILGMHRTAVLKLAKKGTLRPVSGPDVEGFGCNLYRRADVDNLRKERKTHAGCD